MFWVKTGLLFFVALPILAEDKWIWNDNARNANDDHQTRESKLSRYEIFEDHDEDYTGFPGSSLGDYGRPIRPPHRPYPGNRPGIGPGVNPYPIGPHHPGNDLDGRPPFKKFDTCTCSERFNCKSPGISYGHCDVGKSYCCFNKHGGIELEPAPSRPIHSPENGVLVGPDGAGGGYGRPQGLGRPGYGGRPSYGGGHGFVRPGNGPGVLVGPGGPSGIVGRPLGGLGGRPIHSLENGVLVGPGGPYDRPYDRPYGRPGLYGRSANNDEKE